MKADEDRGRENCERIVENNQFAACLNSFGGKCALPTSPAKPSDVGACPQFSLHSKHVCFFLVRQVATKPSEVIPPRWIGGSVVLAVHSVILMEME